jgi:hypothetical protein
MNSPVKLQLPSGAKILARKPSAELLAFWGLDLQLQEGEPESWPDSGLHHLAKILCDLLTYVYVEPRVALDRNVQGAIHPLDIPKQDWTYIVRWAVRKEAVPPTRRTRGRCAHRHGRKRAR